MLFGFTNHEQFSYPQSAYASGEFVHELGNATAILRETFVEMYQHCLQVDPQAARFF